MRIVSHAVLDPRSSFRFDGIVIAAASSGVLWILIVAAACAVARLIS